MKVLRIIGIPHEVHQDEEGLQTMRTLAARMAWPLKRIQASRPGADVPAPVYETKRETNFIR